MNKRLLMVGVPTVGAVALMQVMATGAPAAVQPANVAGTDRVTADAAYPSGVTWNTPFVIQNLGTGTATVVVDFYTIGGSSTPALSYSAGTIAAGASLPVRPANIPNLNTNQKYSVVISSDQPVGAVVNEAATSRLMSYVGATSGASTVYAPNITKNYSGYNTVLYIQNVGTTNLTDVTVVFTPFLGGSTVTKTYSINAGVSVEIDPTTVTELTDDTQYSAKISSATSGASLAAVVNQVAPNAGTEAAYSGFTSGATTLYAPNIVRRYANFNSPAVVQNVGTANTNLTVEYYYGQSFGDQFGQLAKSYTIDPNGAAITLAPGASYAERSHARSDLADGQYSMVVRSSGAPVVAIVNQIDMNDNTKAASYDAFAAGSKKINLPNIVRDYATYQSPIVVQNIGTQATQVTVSYYYGERAQSGPSFAEQGIQGQLATTEQATIAAGANQPFRIHNLSQLAGKDGQYSAVVTSTTSDVVAIVNQVSVPVLGGTGADAAAYEGINQ